MRALIWFRRDLRVNDNTALYESSQAAKDGVVALFVITPQQWKQHDDADCKVHFWLENVRALSESLAKLNIPLIVKTCDSFAETPKEIAAVAKKHKCEFVYFNREYEVNELRRDKAVAAECEKIKIGIRRFHDRVLVPPREIKTKEARFYCVFTPYRKVWDVRAPEFCKVLSKPSKQLDLGIKSSPIPSSAIGSRENVRTDLWPAGESEASKRLKKFAKLISQYATARDVPSIAGTSLLSPYLVSGVVSPRQCMKAALEASQGDLGSNDGARVWVSELAWRDFYTHVMVGFPRVSKHQPFKEKTTGVNWRDHAAELEAWKTGQTGFPIVDAGMRQLNRTGWMHNRLRMVTAMFLTKNMLIDWRLGEQYFMQTLIDGDLAANNGGWQWSASTGTDSVPYFRIFNPFSQSKRFDTDGAFIKKMCPELESVPAKALHDPLKLRAAIADRGIEYPDFVVDYKQSRERALAAFKSLND